MMQLFTRARSEKECPKKEAVIGKKLKKIHFPLKLTKVDGFRNER